MCEEVEDPAFMGTGEGGQLVDGVPCAIGVGKDGLGERMFGGEGKDRFADPL
jgi:hypothetical protein